ncbi:MAG TPA: ABC transporter substrate-binding protein [Acidimicrobiia bacterium]|nr:ABC transporter substrate-binding protein [Acidimicrobiia bacterium]
MRRPLLPAVRLAVVAVAAALGLSACGSDSASPSAAAGAVGAGHERVDLRLGYFPNVTHAAAVAGVEQGIFARALGDGVSLKAATFNAGPAAVEAIFAGALDATFIGPNPAVNAFARSGGEAIRVIAGATSGGASLVVQPTIRSIAALAGRKVATPQLGNTQDVALRAYLLSQGLETDPQGGGDVSIVPQDNAQTLEQFKSGAVSGAWVPEPWASRLVLEGGGKVLLDERTLWPDGQFVTTHLIVRTEFLREHADVVERLLQGHLEATGFVTANPAEAQKVVNAGILRITGKAIPDAVIAAAWGNMSFTWDPVAASLRQGAADAKAVGLLEAGTDLDGIYDLSLLNKLLAGRGQAEVTG